MYPGGTRILKLQRFRFKRLGKRQSTNHSPRPNARSSAGFSPAVSAASASQVPGAQIKVVLGSAFGVFMTPSCGARQTSARLSTSFTNAQVV
ncbi:Uncharacterised protein [Mycobacteroides abscessus subsp. abscessus]|nr:Uncharacterised protein [Mycobacteroides abscessus subsp. abscessus]